jgi:hypothetical protein
MNGRKRERMQREPAFCKKPDSHCAPSGKNSYMASGAISVTEAPAERGIWKTGESAFLVAIDERAHSRAPLHVPRRFHQNIGVFGDGPGEGVFAKTPSPETLASALSATSAVNRIFEET